LTIQPIANTQPNITSMNGKTSRQKIMNITTARDFLKSLGIFTPRTRGGGYTVICQSPRITGKAFMKSMYKNINQMTQQHFFLQSRFFAMDYLQNIFAFLCGTGSRTSPRLRGIGHAVLL
jgi:hypothetical protein